MNKFNLEDRLIDFCIKIDQLVEILPNTHLGRYISNQATRSSASSALNYGEVMGAESTKDFVHKLKIVLKELRETFVCIKIIRKRPLVKNVNLTDSVYCENEELIKIVVSSIKTANKRNR